MAADCLPGEALNSARTQGTAGTNFTKPEAQNKGDLRKCLKKPRKYQKAQSPKRPEAWKPPIAKARVLTRKPDPKAREPSPAHPNNSPGSVIG